MNESERILDVTRSDEADKIDRQWPPPLLVSIDPSIRSMGYAIFISGRLTTSGTIKEKKGDGNLPLAQRIQLTTAALAKIIPATDINNLHIDIIIEEPTAFESSVSKASVHNHSLKKLIMIVGAVCWHAYLLKATTTFIPVGKWKGQLSKEITTRRMEQKYGRKFGTHDEADAVGIGDWYLNNKDRV